MSDTRLYWHETMTHERFDELERRRTTWGDVLRTYRQPDWCGYPEALQGPFGCWSLLDLRIHTIADCASCDLCNQEAVVSADDA